MCVPSVKFSLVRILIQINVTFFNHLRSEQQQFKKTFNFVVLLWRKDQCSFYFEGYLTHCTARTHTHTHTEWRFPLTTNCCPHRQMRLKDILWCCFDERGWWTCCFWLSVSHMQRGHWLKLITLITRSRQVVLPSRWSFTLTLLCTLNQKHKQPGPTTSLQNSLIGLPWW